MPLNSAERSARDLARSEWLLLALGCAIHLFVVPHTIAGDGVARYAALVQLADEGRLSAERYSLVQALAAWPLFKLGEWLGHRAAATAHFTVVVFLATLAIAYRSLRSQLDAAVLRRTLLLLVSASMFGHHVQTYSAEVLTACAALLGFTWLALDHPRRGGLALTLAVVNSPATAAGLALTSLVLWWRRRRLFAAYWPLVLAIGLVLAESTIRRGSPWQAGYDGDAGFQTLLPYSGRPGFSYPWLLGVVSLLFSFGKGLLFFAPGLALLATAAGAPPGPVESRLRSSALTFSAGLVAVYASWWAWYGGWFWGPRFLLFASVPACLLLARHLTRLPTGPAARAAVLLATALSVWVGVAGSAYGQAGMEVCLQANYQLEFLCWYVPEFSALARPFVVDLPVRPWQLLVIAHGALVAAVLLAPVTAALVGDLARGLRRDPAPASRPTGVWGQRSSVRDGAPMGPAPGSPRRRNPTGE